MTFYIGVPLIGATTGKIERVASRDNATELSRANADNFRVEAFVRWPDLHWTIEEVGEQKYLVKGERPGLSNLNLCELLAPAQDPPSVATRHRLLF
jgi:hypothetical protein